MIADHQPERTKPSRRRGHSQDVFSVFVAVDIGGAARWPVCSSASMTDGGGVTPRPHRTWCAESSVRSGV